MLEHGTRTSAFPLIGECHLLLIAKCFSVIFDIGGVQVFVIVLVRLKLNSNKELNFARSVEDPWAASQSRHVELIVKLYLEVKAKFRQRPHFIKDS